MSIGGAAGTNREFLAEASEIIETMRIGFATIDDQRRTGAPQPARLNEVFRAAHSLKGLAGMFGVDTIGSLAHEMETLLDGLRLGRLVLTDALMGMLYACTDSFQRLLETLTRGEEIDEARLRGLIEEVKARAQAEGADDVGVGFDLNLPPESLSVLTEYEEHRLKENLRLGVPIFRVRAPLDLETFEQALSALNNLLAEKGEIVTTLPSSDPSASGITFDIVVATTESIESLSADLHELSGGRYAAERVDRSRTQLPARTNDESGDDGDEDYSARMLSETVRVDIRKLDDLMGIVGELVLARGGLARVSDELKGEIGHRGLAVDLHRLVRTLSRRIADLQGAIMQVRMIPLGQVFERLKWIVRRTANDLGKEIELQFTGEETELDKLIVEELVDPLMHLVRNAVDHGIESPDAREALGKPRVGTIRIDAFPRGNHVVIDMRDDGRGIDDVAVKRTALERGIVDEDHIGALTRRQVWDLLFQPGFTTKREVTGTSGRGVGLDVVKHNIGQLSGIIDLESEPGQSTRFTITLPITLAIIQALIVKVAEAIYALPLASVLEVVLIRAADLCTVDGHEMVVIRGDTLPLIRLNKLFGHRGLPKRPATEADVDGIGYVAVVGLAQHRAALFIDDVTGQQDIVIKSLGSYLGRVRGFAGATQLGDHETILVLDVAALVQEHMSRPDPRRGQPMTSTSAAGGP